MGVKSEFVPKIQGCKPHGWDFAILQPYPMKKSHPIRVRLKYFYESTTAIFQKFYYQLFSLWLLLPFHNLRLQKEPFP